MSASTKRLIMKNISSIILLTFCWCVLPGAHCCLTTTCHISRYTAVNKSPITSHRHLGPREHDDGQRILFFIDRILYGVAFFLEGYHTGYITVDGAFQPVCCGPITAHKRITCKQIIKTVNYAGAMKRRLGQKLSQHYKCVQSYSNFISIMFALSSWRIYCVEEMTQPSITIY